MTPIKQDEPSNISKPLRKHPLTERKINLRNYTFCPSNKQTKSITVNSESESQRKTFKQTNKIYHNKQTNSESQEFTLSCFRVEAAAERGFRSEEKEIIQLKKDRDRKRRQN
jgi:hypothetical protein